MHYCPRCGERFCSNCAEAIQPDPWQRLDYIRTKAIDCRWSSFVENAEVSADRALFDAGYLRSRRQDVTWKMLGDWNLEHDVYVFSRNEYLYRQGEIAAKNRKGKAKKGDGKGNLVKRKTRKNEEMMTWISSSSTLRSRSGKAEHFGK